jgi:hypothetical protein
MSVSVETLLKEAAPHPAFLKVVRALARCPSLIPAGVPSHPVDLIHVRFQPEIFGIIYSVTKSHVPAGGWSMVADHPVIHLVHRLLEYPHYISWYYYNFWVLTYVREPEILTALHRAPNGFDYRLHIRWADHCDGSQVPSTYLPVCYYLLDRGVPIPIECISLVLEWTVWDKSALLPWLRRVSGQYMRALPEHATAGLLTMDGLIGFALVYTPSITTRDVLKAGLPLTEMGLLEYLLRRRPIDYTLLDEWIAHLGRTPDTLSKIVMHLRDVQLCNHLFERFMFVPDEESLAKLYASKDPLDAAMLRCFPQVGKLGMSKTKPRTGRRP